jgi:filamentous hemagglutinin family protein
LHDLSLLACVWAALFLAAPVFAAGISGGVVSAGSASITQSGSLTTVKQSSDKAVINWGNFSIGNGSSVRFVQPSASSIVLNRVTGSQASVIQGALQANGQVWVLNPNGVLIAPGSQVVTGSFLATTRSLTDQQFMAGNYAFTDGGVPGASVINQGSIIVAEGGYAVLAGEAVRNEGYIEANLGQVVLGGAKAFTLDLSGDNTLAFVVTAPVDVTPTDGKAIVDNTGSIQAAGGRVLMTARAASQVVGQVINTDGVVAATSAQMVNGKIVLDGGAGAASVGGNLNASGKAFGQTGGSIDVNAQKIQVKATAKLDVSGDAGGGKIAIGGGGPSTRTQSFTPAASTTIASGARLDASAVTRGDGGEILVFADLKNPLAFTQVAGTLIARGGSQAGNGGFVETSGYRLDVSGIVVNTLAPKGRTGLWLLDPVNITISGADTAPGECSITDNACSTIKATELVTQLNAGTDVYLTADQSITVSADVNWGNAQTLSLTAGTSISINATITGKGVLLLTAGTGITVNNQISMDFKAFGIGTVTMTSNAGITIAAPVLAASQITLNANKIAGSSESLTIGAELHSHVIAVDAGNGWLTVAAAGQINAGALIGLTAKDVTLSGPVSASAVGNTVTISGASSVNVNSAVTGDTLAVTAAGGTITLAADLSATGATLSAPTLNVNTGLSTASVTLQNNTINWGATGAYTGGGGSVFTLDAPAVVGTTTLNLANDLTLQASRININNPLAWSTKQLRLNADQSPNAGGPTKGVALSASLTGTNGAKLMIMGSGFITGSGSQAINLTGTPTAQAAFTPFGTTTAQADDVKDYPVGANVVTVTINNTGISGGGSGGGSETTVTTPVIDSAAASSAAKAAADATAKAAADAAAAKAANDAAAAKVVTLANATKTVVDQAVTLTVAATTATASASVVAVPAPAPVATTNASNANSSATSSTSDAISTSTDSNTSAASATSTSTATASTTSSSTTTTSTTTTTNASATNSTNSVQNTAVTQEFVEPVTVAALSNTTSSKNDPGDSSAATTSATTGPTLQTATPASSTSAAPAAPALTPVVVSKDGADAGDFTLQTVKPPAPVTAPKQQARTTERVTNTSVSPGISLQSTQKTPPPSGSVLGREISGVGNSSAW